MRFVTVAAVLVALAACSPKGGNEEGAGPAAAAPASPGARMTPGQWSTKVSMLEMTMGGVKAPPRAMQATTVSECVTSDELDDFVNRRSMDERATGADCRINDLKVANGRFEGRSECTDPAMGGTRTMVMTGTYGETRVDMEMAMTGQSPQGPVSMKMRVLSERVGDCPG
jgi:hypothetical protein